MTGLFQGKCLISCGECLFLWLLVSLDWALGWRHALTLGYAVTSRNEHELKLFSKTCARLDVEPMVIPASLNVGNMETEDQRRRRVGAWQSSSVHQGDVRRPFYDGLAVGTVPAENAATLLANLPFSPRI